MSGENFYLNVSQGIMSNTFKRSTEFLLANLGKEKKVEWHKPTNFLNTKKVVYKSLLQYNWRVNFEKDKKYNEIFIFSTRFEHKCTTFLRLT